MGNVAGRQAAAGAPVPADAVEGTLGRRAKLAGQDPVGGDNDVVAGQQGRGEVAGAVGAVVQCHTQLRRLLAHLIHPLRRLIRRSIQWFEICSCRGWRQCNMSDLAVFHGHADQGTETVGAGGKAENAISSSLLPSCR